MPVIEARGLAIRAGPIPLDIVEVELLREAAFWVHADDTHLDQNAPVKLCARGAALRAAASAASAEFSSALRDLAEEALDLARA